MEPLFIKGFHVNAQNLFYSVVQQPFIPGVIPPLFGLLRKLIHQDPAHPLAVCVVTMHDDHPGQAITDVCYFFSPFRPESLRFNPVNLLCMIFDG